MKMKINFPYPSSKSKEMQKYKASKMVSSTFGAEKNHLNEKSHFIIYKVKYQYSTFTEH